MSINVQLHDGLVPYLVSPYENFFFLIHHVKLTVESGNGYPGQGGCFYGGEGRCYVSQYRLVYVSDTAQEGSAYRSFSLPFYGICDWSFNVSFFGAKSWKGHVNRVPGGGLVGVGRFTMEFLSFGFDEFRNHVLPLLENSRALHGQFRDLTTPSVLLVPGKLPEQDGNSQRLAYYSTDDPMTLFIIDEASAPVVLLRSGTAAQKELGTIVLGRLKENRKTVGDEGAIPLLMELVQNRPAGGVEATTGLGRKKRPKQQSKV